MLLPPKPSNYLLSLALSAHRTKHSFHDILDYVSPWAGCLPCVTPDCLFTATIFFPSCDRGSIVVVLAALPDICHSLVQEWGFFFEFTVFVVSQQIIHGTRISVVGKAVIHFTPRDPGAVRPNRMRHLATFTHLIFYRYHGRPE